MTNNYTYAQLAKCTPSHTEGLMLDADPAMAESASVPAAVVAACVVVGILIVMAVAVYVWRQNRRTVKG